jgi:hypothetical protein
MTEYTLHFQPATETSANEAKEKRRKVLDGVFQRRKQIYKRNNLKQTLAYYQYRKNTPDLD